MSCSEWKQYSLGDICENIFSGGTPSTKNTNYWNGSIPWLSSGETRNNFINSTEKTITLDGVNNSSTKLAKKGDIVIASAGQGYTRGQTSFCNIDTYINQSLIAIRTNNAKIHNKYLYYNLKGRYDELRQLSDGHSIRGSLTTKIIKDLVIKLPSLEEQEKIANILSSLDDKIELNNEMNKTLEEMAQSIYKRWFVDFEFPNEDGQPYKSSGGEMVESELGMIPKGWEVGSFSDISEILDSKRIPLSKREREKRANIYPYYGAASLMDYVDDYIFEGIHVLMGEDGTVIDKDGFPILQYVGGKFWVNNHAHVLKGKNEFSNEFVYLYLSNTNVTHLVTGAVQPKINPKNLTSLKLPIPDKNMTVKFNSLAKNIFEYIYEIRQENKKLEEIRSILLPVLMNGTINIK